MKLTPPINPNYCATVVTIKAITPFENSDNIVGTPFFGFQAIISKDHKVGDIGILFSAETQLSTEYCYENNLFRHAHLNKDTTQTGYLEDNRRVKAVKFRGNRSDALFMPIESLAYTKAKIEELSVGDEFDFLNGKPICEKYVVFRRIGVQREQPKQYKRVEEKFMPEHFKNDNFLKVIDTLNPNAECIVTQKLHGTSIRIGNTIVKRKPTFIDRMAKLLGAKIVETEYDYIFGSRKVIKDANNPNKTEGFYDFDIWTQEGKKLEGILPKNYIVYGELVGYTPQGAALQQNYTYDQETGTVGLYVYRVAFINADGTIVDLTWDQMREACLTMGLKTVSELWRGKVKDLVTGLYMDKRFLEEGHRTAVPLGQDMSIVDEGICIRIEGMQPQIYKLKSPKFLAHETKLLDEGVEDVEEAA